MHTRRSRAVALVGTLVLGVLVTCGAGIAQADSQGDKCGKQPNSSSSAESKAPKLAGLDLGDGARCVLQIAENLF
jgi:hypothetical protein